jgi:hypothetical protein
VGAARWSTVRRRRWGVEPLPRRAPLFGMLTRSCTDRRTVAPMTHSAHGGAPAVAERQAVRQTSTHPAGAVTPLAATRSRRGSGLVPTCWSC